MSKFDKYRVNNLQESANTNIKSVSKFDKYKTTPRKPTYKEENPWVNRLKDFQGVGQTINEYQDVVGKSFNRGVLGLLDLPQLAATGVEELGNLIPGGTPTHHISALTPVSEHVRNVANKVGYAGFNEPKTDTTMKRVVGGTFGGIGSMVGGAGIGGVSTKVGMPIISRFLGSPKEAFQLAKTGARLGGTAAGLEELGVDPLTANLIAGTAGPLVGSTGKNFLNKISDTHKNLKASQRVKEALKTQIGEENLPGVLENIKTYRKQKNPINLQLTTPEIAQDVGLSRLYRTESNLPSIPQRYAENDAKLLEALEGIGTTRLPESVKGEAIRAPFIERFNKKITRRKKLTEPLYEELKAIQEGLDPINARMLLKEEMAVSGVDDKSMLEKFYKGLTRNDINPSDLDKVKELKATIKNIDSKYQHLNPAAIKQLKAPLLEELNQIESSLLPRPIQIENTIQNLGDRVNDSYRSGASNAANRYDKIKDAYTADLATNPTQLKHREEYKRLSKPINEIERSSLLHNFVKKNRDVSRLEGFVAPSEKIPSLILDADLSNTKILINNAKGNKETLDLIKGAYIDKLLETSKLNSGNFSYDKANKFLGNKYTKEKLSVVFNNKEKKKLDQFLDILKRRNQVETMGKGSGSDTHQKFKVGNEFNESLGGFGKLFKKAAFKTSGLGTTGEMAFDVGNEVAKGIKDKKYNSILEESLLNPDAFRKLMTNKDKLKRFRDFYRPLPPFITGVNLGNIRGIDDR